MIRWDNLVIIIDTKYTIAIYNGTDKHNHGKTKPIN